MPSQRSIKPSSVQIFVGRQCQELLELLVESDSVEEGVRLVPAALAGQLLELRVLDLPHVLALGLAAAPTPRSQDSRYWSPTLTLSRIPSSVTSPPGTRTSSRSPASTETSSRRRPTWFGRAPRIASKTSVATGTRSG